MRPREPAAGDRNVWQSARVDASIEARVMTLYEWKDQDHRLDPATIMTFLVGILAAAILATVL